MIQLANINNQTTENSALNKIESSESIIEELVLDKKVSNEPTSFRGKIGGVKKFKQVESNPNLPELTISNLLAENKKNDIKFPR